MLDMEDLRHSYPGGGDPQREKWAKSYARGTGVTEVRNLSTKWSGANVLEVKLEFQDDSKRWQRCHHMFCFVNSGIRISVICDPGPKSVREALGLLRKVAEAARRSSTTTNVA
jgi:hypothetical protein